MEEFITSNLDRYRWLLERVKPEPKSATPPNAHSSIDNIICARVRPLSDEETSAGLPASIFARSSERGTFDAHELRHAVRGKPTLRVSIRDVYSSWNLFLLIIAGSHILIRWIAPTGQRLQLKISTKSL